MKTKDVKLNFFKSVGNFFFFSFPKVKSKHFRPLATNVKTLGEEADLEAQTFNLVQTPIESTNVHLSTKPAFLPNVCYRLFFFQ